MLTFLGEFLYDIMLFKNLHLFIITVNTSLESSSGGLRNISSIFLIRIHFLITCGRFKEWVDRNGLHVKIIWNCIIKVLS